MHLGLLVTEDLCWTTHVKTKLAKSNKIFNFMKRIILFQVSILRKKMLYQTMILSVLFYCSQTWCVTTGIFKVLEKFQSKVLRWVIRSEDYNETVSKLNLYPICYRIARADLIVLWKTWHGTMESSSISSCSSLGFSVVALWLTSLYWLANLTFCTGLQLVQLHKKVHVRIGFRIMSREIISV